MTAINRTVSQNPLKQAAVVISRLEERIAQLEQAGQDRFEPIAIVGMGCRFPGGANSPPAYWELLDAGRDAVQPLAPRWALLGMTPGPALPRWAGLLTESPEAFDAAFFGISPREARSLDPQHRLLLEVAWETLEDAGVPPLSLAGSRTGVFVGAIFADYARLVARQPPDWQDAYCSTGNMLSIAAGRLSYTLGLQGPCLTVDTACSSSLAAIHLACGSLRSRECDLALAGGVNLLLSVETLETANRLQALSPDGRCRTFDAGANGYVRGEGCGLVALKRLADARRDGDPIWAVIRGSAINQDGRSTGLTTPNVLAQQALLREALKNARVDAAAVGYVETHGTGTSLGDPIEVEALRAVVGPARPDGTHCVLGAVKTNFGHLEGAAGVAGLIKVVLSLHHERIPKILNFRTLNPRIRLEGTALALALEAAPWPRTQRPRFAGVSSFGLSGTNLHVVLEEAPALAQKAPAMERAAELFFLSAKSPAALCAQAARLAAHLVTHQTLALGDVAFSLATTRSPLEHRLAVVAATRQELRSALENAAQEHPWPGVARGKASSSPGKLAFLFTGQGAQVPGMGQELFAAFPVFRDAFDRCAALFDRELERPLRQVMWGEAGGAEAALLDQTAYTQPALFTLAYALWALWESWGLRPDLVAGHSIGELTAACVAGVFSLADAVRLVAARGRLMQALPAAGAMLSIAAEEAEVAAALEPYAASVSIAAVNAKKLVVISGTAAAVQAIAATFAARGVRIKPLRVSHAFHSPLIDPMLAAFLRVAESITYKKPTCGLASTLLGKLCTDEVTNPAYWVRQAREAVRFADAAQALHAAGAGTFVELGPRPVLLGLLPECLAGAEPVLLASLAAGQKEPASVLAALANFVCRGGAVAWSGLFPEGGRRVPLPTYPFARERHFVDLAPEHLEPRDSSSRFLLSGVEVSMPGAVLHHVLSVSPRHQSFLSDHRVFGEVVVPGAFHVAVILAIAEKRWPQRALELIGVEFLRAITLKAGQEVKLHAVLTPEPEGEGYRFELATQAAPGSTWTLHARGRVQPLDNPPGALPRPEALHEHAVQPIDDAVLLQRMAALCIDWGPQWRWLHDARIGSGTALATLSPASASSHEVAPLHPILLDNGFGLAVLGVPFMELDGTPKVPFAVERLRFFRVPWGKIRCGAVRRPAAADISDFVLADEEGVVAEVFGFAFRRASRELFQRGGFGAPSGAFYRLAWEEASLSAASFTLPVGRFIVVAAAGSEAAAALSARLGDCVLTEPSGLAAVLTKEAAVAGVVCLWESGAEENPPATALRVTSEGLLVVQALLGREPARLWWVTSGAAAVNDGERVAIGTAPLWGMGRTLMQEHPELDCTLIDLGPGGKVAETLPRELWAEDAERQVAWRGGRRLVARLLRCDQSLAAQSAQLCKESTVVVTGGLGALGLHVARWLAQNGVKHLLLVGRRGPGTPGAAEAVAELEAMGTKVTVAAVDVADRNALGELLKRTPDAWPLRGVVHAAGVVDDGVLAEQTAERFARVLSPKVSGVWNLHELTLGQKLDFFVLFSSASGLLGAAGQANYAAANSFLDALAADRQAAGLSGQSLAWGAWSQVGLAAELSEIQRIRLARQGMGWIAPEAGIALLEQALLRPEANLGVMVLELEATRRALGTAVPPLWRALVPEHSGRPAAVVERQWPVRLAALPEARRADEVREAVQAEVARVLGLRTASAVPTERAFSELGMDSLMAVELRNALGQRIGMTLPATLAFDHPTVDALTRWLLEQVLFKAGRVAPPANVALKVHPDEPIAIVGMGCRFPGGVESPESFWKLLAEGTDAITEVPRERWDIDAFYDPDPGAAGKMTTRWGGFVANLDRFDPGFFGISPKEAVSIDPQARMLLETSWEALENAGQTPERLLGSETGVYMGLCGNEYQFQATADASAINAYSFLGTVHSATVGRLSYFLGLKGPSLAVDTACSSSLVAVHLACEALRRGECVMALAGGANVVLSPASTVYFSRLRAMSPTGRCHTFSADADGYVRSEGCGVVVLKRLSDAQRDGDRILAVIRGSAVNQDGRSNGLTAPNGPSQEAVIRRALAQAGVAPAEVGYVECHGTGTPLGDPIEVQVLGGVLGEGRGQDQPVMLGSVKTNIGHTEGAAGVAGLIKTVLALEHERIPKSLHYSKPNPYIGWSELKVAVAAEAVEWPRSGRPRRAGVSSFGFSGTNAHLVLEEAPIAAPRPAAPSRQAELLVLSAKSAEALSAQVSQVRDYVEKHPEQGLGDLAFSLATARGAMEHRLAVVVDSKATLRTALSAAAEGKTPRGMSRGAVSGKRGKLAFLFPGQGAQSLGMGRGLYAAWPAFAAAFDQCVSLFDKELERPLLEVMWAEAGSAAAAQLDQTEYTQPALFALGYGLYALWSSFGIKPELVGGHSVGELLAACVAGVFSLQDGVKLVAARGRLMQALPAGGAMTSIAAPEAEVAAEVAKHGAALSIAAWNGPGLTVIAGDEERVEAVAAVFAGRGKKTKRLPVSHAFHSARMDPMLEAFLRVAKSVRYTRPALAMVSNLSGKLCSEEVTRPEYWVRHVRDAVRFGEGVQALAEAGAGTFVELGKKAVLLGLVPACLGEAEAALVPSLRVDLEEAEAILEALGSLYVRGEAIDWQGVFFQGARRVDLPTYPWQRERYWIEPSPRGFSGAASRFPLAGIRLRIPGAALHHVLSIGTRQQFFLQDHVVFGKVVVPGAFYLSMILGIAAERWPDRAIELTGIEFLRPIVLQSGQEAELHALLTPEEEGEGCLFELATRAERPGEPQWTTHARGRVQPTEAVFSDLPPPDALAERATESVNSAALFDKLSAMRIDWGPLWRWLHDGRLGAGAAIATLLPTYPGAHEVAPLHPILLDNGFAVSHLSTLNAQEDSVPQLPFAVERLRWWRAPRGSVRCGGVPRLHEPKVSDFVLADHDGVVAEVKGFTGRRAPIEAFLRQESGAAAGAWYCLDWSEAPPAEGSQRGPADRFMVVANPHSALARELCARLSGCELVEPAGLGAAMKGESGIGGVICIWEGNKEEEPAAAAQRIAQEGLSVVQALLSRGPMRLWWVTKNAVAVAPGEQVEVRTTPLWGLLRTVMQEQPELGSTLLDVEAGSEGIDALLRELRAEDEETQVAWRGGRRYVARLRRSDAEKVKAEDVLTGPGTVLVSGGLGALGQQAARWLARQGVKQLLLMGRRGLESPGAAELVAELAALGTQVDVAAVDVTDRAALKDVLEALPADKPLKGVIHAAGVLEDGVLGEQTAERFARVLAPKVAGAWNLHALTLDKELRFFVMFSSISGMLGSAGQSNYAAANSFLDGLAAYRRGHGLAGQSLCWGPWEEAGMAAELGAAQKGRLKRRGIGALAKTEGLELLGKALRRGEAQLGVMKLELEALGKALGEKVPAVWRELLRAPFLRGKRNRKGEWAARLSHLPAEKREAEVRAAVSEELARVLALKGGSAVPQEKPLSELGMDSLMAVELRDALGQRVGAMLPATLAFDYPTLSSLVKYLLEQVLVLQPPAPLPESSHLSDAEIRRAMASISIAELRRTDLLGKLLKLVRHAETAPKADAHMSIDEMGAEELLRMFGSNDDSAGQVEGN